MANLISDQRFAALEPSPIRSSSTAPKITRLASGGFVAGWSESNNTRLFVQIFDRDGEPIGQSFSLSGVGGTQKDLSMAPLANGGFVATWAQFVGIPDFLIAYRLFDAAGNPLSGIEYLNFNRSFLPDVVTLEGGGFLITWGSLERGGMSGADIKGQLFTAGGAKVGGEFFVTPNFGAGVDNPQAVALPGGGFIVTWADGAATRAQIYDGSFQPVGGSFELAPSDDGPVDVAMLASGKVVIAYMVGDDLAARIFDPLGLDPVLEFPVATTVAGIQSRPSIAALASGEFLITWRDSVGPRPDDPEWDKRDGEVRGQLFAADGTKIGEEFLVNVVTAGGQTSPVAAEFGSGDLAALWVDYSTGINPTPSIQMRLLFSAEVGTSAADVIAGTTDRDFYFGLDGADSLSGGDAADELDGGEGDDVLDGGQGDDLLDGGGGADQLSGGSDDDVLRGGGGADQLGGGSGNDHLDGGTGADSMTGGLGDDVYVVDDAGDVVVENGGEGTDEIRTSLAAYSLIGTNVENLAAASDAAHDFRGTAGNNVVTGGGGNDFLRLHDGGVDSAAGGGGHDVFLFGASLTPADSADGGAGIDQVAIQGNYAGANALTLGAGVVGVESLAILPGFDIRFGDPGTNFYDYDITTVDSNVAPGVQLIVDANRLRSQEDLIFNGSAETDGSFFIWGGGGVDTLTGGAKNDVFYFGENMQFGSSDTVDGGAGTDQLGLRGNYTILFGAGQLTSIENIGLVSAFDTRFGALGNKFNYGLQMHDANVAAGVLMTVDGAALRGGETLNFQGGAETDGRFLVYGGQGEDIITTGAGDDILQGGLGMDWLTGGGGADTFRFITAGDSTSPKPDSIIDFTPGTDKIDLSRIDANTLAAGDQAFTWIGSNAFTGSGAASAGELRVYQHFGSWVVEGDTDGNGVADLVITVTTVGGAPPAQGDFLP